MKLIRMIRKHEEEEEDYGRDLQRLYGVAQSLQLERELEKERRVSTFFFFRASLSNSVWIGV